MGSWADTTQLGLPRKVMTLFSSVIHNPSDWLTLSPPRPAKDLAEKPVLATTRGQRDSPTILKSPLGTQQRPSEGLEVLWGEKRGWALRQGSSQLPLTMLVNLLSGLTFPSPLEILENTRKLLDVWGKGQGTKNYPTPFPKCIKNTSSRHTEMSYCSPNQVNTNSCPVLSHAALSFRHLYFRTSAEACFMFSLA